MALDPFDGVIGELLATVPQHVVGLVGRAARTSHTMIDPPLLRPGNGLRSVGRPTGRAARMAARFGAYNCWYYSDQYFWLHYAKPRGQGTQLGVLRRPNR
jgi:hypothetical protein